MSKETAMAVATGTPVTEVNPSLVAGSPPAEGIAAPTQKSDELASTPFSKFARKEAALVEQKQQLKREREAFAAQEAQVKAYQEKLQQFEQAKKQDPVAALKMIGFSEQDIFNYMANQAPPELTPEQKAAQAATEAAETRIKAFEEEQTRKLLLEQQQQDQTLIGGFKSDISKSIQAQPDKFEYCNYYGPEAEALAYEITLAVVKESKGAEILTPLQALTMAEEYFEEKDREMNKLKKRQPKESPAPPKADPTRTRTLSSLPGQEAPKPPITKSRTLHNGATSSVASARHLRQETREQKRDRLINLLKNG